MDMDHNQNIPMPENNTENTAAEKLPETTPKAPGTPAAPQPVKIRRVGTFSLGLMLVAVGAILLASIFLPYIDVIGIMKFAPIVLIVLGIEVLVYAARPDVKIKYDGVSIFLCIVIMLTAGCSGALAAVSKYLDPDTLSQQYTSEQQVRNRIAEALNQIPNAHDFVHDYSVYNYSDDWVLGVPLNAKVELYLTMNYGAQSSAEEFVHDCKTVVDAMGAAGIEVVNYRFDVYQWNLEDGDVWELTLDEWSAGGSEKNMLERVETTSYVDGEAYEEGSDREEEGLLNKYTETFGTDPLTDYQEEYGEVSFGASLIEYMRDRLDNAEMQSAETAQAETAQEEQMDTAAQEWEEKKAEIDADNA